MLPSAYHYAPLSNSPPTIRFIHLLPGTGTSPISLTIALTPLHAAPEYEALSYAWGPSSSSSTTLINKTSHLPISPTLMTALHHLRDSEKERTLWIDAICINQSDAEERGAQVGMMAEIYARAKRVVIWIGEADDSSAHAIEFLREMGRRVVRNRMREYNEHWRGRDEKITVLEGEDSGADEEILARKIEGHLRKVGYQQWISEDELGDVFSRPIETMGPDPVSMQYSKVSNVISGIPVSELDISGRRRQNSNHMYYLFRGERKEDWETVGELLGRKWFCRTWVVQEVWKAADAILQCGNTIIRWKTFALVMGNERTWNDIGRFINGIENERERRGLKRRFGLAIHLANKPVLRNTTLSDILWNTWDRESSDPRDKVFSVLGLVEDCFKAGLEVDYNKDITVVFRKVAATILRNEGRLNLLVAACGLSRQDGLPSWVPDWRNVASSERPTLLVNRSKMYAFYAAESMTYVKLHSHGFNASGTTPSKFRFSSDLTILHASCIIVDTISVLSSVSANASNDEIVRSACGLTEASLAETSPHIQIAPEKFEKEVKTVLYAGFLDPTPLADEIMANVMSRRVFFITKNGSLGIGPACSMSGDVVCIISGCEFPIILRREEEHYVLVGEAYVRNLMNGEALRGGVGWEEVAIC